MNSSEVHTYKYQPSLFSEIVFLVLSGLCAMAALFFALASTGVFGLRLEILAIGTFTQRYIGLLYGTGSLLAIGVLVARVRKIRKVLSGEREIVITAETITMPLAKSEYTTDTVDFDEITAVDWMDEGDNASSSVIVIRAVNSKTYKIRQSWLGSKDDLLEIGEALQTAISEKKKA